MVVSIIDLSLSTANPLLGIYLREWWIPMKIIFMENIVDWVALMQGSFSARWQERSAGAAYLGKELKLRIPHWKSLS